MPRASTSRLMLLFLAVSVVTALIGSLLRILMFSFSFRSQTLAGFLVYPLLIYVLTLLAAGWFQSRILSRHRTPLRWWTLATALGALAAGILGYLTPREALGVVGPAAQGRLSDWIQTLTWSATGAACLGTAQAFAIWGRRWTSDTLLWLTGLLLVRVLASALPPLFHAAAESGASFPLLSRLVVPLLSAALAGAGTAWLLDRIVFRVPAGQPFEAGGRTVE